MELNIIKEKIGQLRVAEGQTKALIAELVVAVTERIHEHNEVTSANAFMLALTPLNQKKVLSFFKAHAGHKVEEGILTTRQKAYVKDGVKVDPYQQASDKFDAFKGTGMSFWQWAVSVKKKEDTKIDVTALAKKAAKLRDLMQEAITQNVLDKSQAAAMMLGDLLTVDEVMDALAVMAQKADNAVKQAKEQATSQAAASAAV